jgi:transposase InsO family protein
VTTDNLLLSDTHHDENAACQVKSILLQMKTTVSDRAAPSPLDRVNRQFRAAKPNALWVADFTYV